MPGRTLIGGSESRGQGPDGSWPLRVRFMLVAALAICGGTHGAIAAQGHEGGEFGITIPVERVPAGASLPIVGAEWASDSRLEVRLQASGSEFTTIGVIQTDSAGHFATAVRLPNALPSGVAVIQVVSTYGVLDTAVVTIDPAAPQPSIPPGIAPPRETAPDGVDPVPFIALTGAIGALVILVARTRRHAQA